MKNRTTLLSWPAEALSPNARVHWRKLHDAKKAYKEEAYYRAGVPPIGKKRVFLEIKFFPPDRRRRDLDNHMAMMKSALDGLALRWGVDDHIFRPIGEWGPPVKNPYVEIKIIKSEE